MSLHGFISNFFDLYCNWYWLNLTCSSWTISQLSAAQFPRFTSFARDDSFVTFSTSWKSSVTYRWVRIPKLLESCKTKLRLWEPIGVTKKAHQNSILLNFTQKICTRTHLPPNSLGPGRCVMLLFDDHVIPPLRHTVFWSLFFRR